jgi:hypothetical protein
MKILTIFLLYSSISFTQNKMTQTDQSLSSFLEGKNNSPPLDIAMESFALATPFIEFGFSGFDQIGHEKLRPHLATAMIVQLPIIISKYAFKRSRPERQYNPRLWNTRFTPSFPSGHAATTAAWATSLALSSPKNTSIMIGYTLLSGYSQVYVGNHYVSDVIAGWILGWITGRYIHSIYETHQNNPIRIPLLKISIFL